MAVRFSFPFDGGEVAVLLKHITHAEKLENRSKLFLVNGDVLEVNAPIAMIERSLLHHGFVRIHERYVINTELIQLYIPARTDRVVLAGGKQLLVGKQRRACLLRFMRSRESNKELSIA
ncbi:MAG: LytTR family transcriptional regulator DNA-binding domain-containing protein [Bacteroidales bacterium]|jgi:two-component system LytT family response regulator